MVDFLSYFLIIAGLVIGLGAVTVIDIHGFLARQSSYWTETTIRTHKVTKPLIWIGTTLVSIGISLVYRGDLLIFQWVIITAMVGNGIFLSFVVSPFLVSQERKNKSQEILPQSLQTKIIISFVFSFFSWWGSLVLFVDYLLG